MMSRLFERSTKNKGSWLVIILSLAVIVATVFSVYYIYAFESDPSCFHYGGEDVVTTETEQPPIRPLDLVCFSLQVMTSAAGLGDIVPNKTNIRVAVAIESLVSVILFVLAIAALAIGAVEKGTSSASQTTRT